MLLSVFFFFFLAPCISLLENFFFFFKVKMGDTAKSQWKSNRASSSLTNSKPTRPKISPETVALLVESIQSNDVETTIDKHMRELRKALGYTDDEVCVINYLILFYFSLPCWFLFTPYLFFFFHENLSPKMHHLVYNWRMKLSSFKNFWIVFYKNRTQCIFCFFCFFFSSFLFFEHNWTQNTFD